MNSKTVNLDLLLFRRF